MAALSVAPASAHIDLATLNAMLSTLIAAAALVPSPQLVQVNPDVLLDLTSALGRPAVPVEVLPAGNGSASVALRLDNSPPFGDSAALIRMHPLGPIVWNREFPMPGNVDRLEVRDMVPDGNGGVFVRVQWFSPSGSSQSGRILRYNGTGNLIENVRLGAAQFPSVVPNVYASRNAAVADGVDGLLVGGAIGPTSDPGARVARIFRFDGLSTPTTELALFGSDVRSVRRLSRTADGGLVALLERTSSDYMLAKLDSALTIQWQVPVSLAGTATEPAALEQGADGGIHLVFDGSTAMGAPGGAHMFKFDPVTGATLWSRALGAASDVVSANDLVPLPDGAVLITGTFEQSANLDAYIQRYESDGSLGLRQLVASQDAWRTLVNFVPDGDGWLSVGDLQAIPSTGTPARVVIARFDDFSELGQPYCGPAVANSTGLPGRTRAFGSPSASENSMVLRSSQLPAGVFGLYVLGSEQGLMPILGGSTGRLCITGTLGRFNDSMGLTGVDGTATYVLDLSALPTSAGTVSAAPLDRWNFQFWYRDGATQPNSNATDAVSVLLL